MVNLTEKIVNALKKTFTIIELGTHLQVFGFTCDVCHYI